MSEDVSDGRPPLHLWIDFETTGLTPEIDTVLEIGWTITDDRLRMLTPLRSRLAVLDPPARTSHPEYYTHPLSGTRGGFNPCPVDGNWDLLPEVVRTMHAESGLIADLANAWDSPTERLSVITHPRDFERLLSEDLKAVGFAPGRDKLVISGAGVSHFDVHVLAVHWPEPFPLLPGSYKGWNAYWQHDTSVAWRTLGPIAVSVLQDRRPSLSETGPGDPLWSLFTAEAFADPSVAHLVYPRSDGWAVLRGDRVRKHRAADDVVESLLFGRVLHRTGDIFQRAPLVPGQ